MKTLDIISKITVKAGWIFLALTIFRLFFLTDSQDVKNNALDRARMRENRTGMYNIIDSTEMSLFERNYMKKDMGVKVTATVYNAVPEQTNSNPSVTANGFKIKDMDNPYQYHIIALSRDLLKIFPYGSVVQVSGAGYLDGYYTVRDTMNKRYKNYVDILINQDMPIGKWKNVTLKIK